MSESFVEPVESNYHHSNINDDNIRRHRKPEHHKLATKSVNPRLRGYLLPRVEQVHVDGIHPCLTCSSSSKQHSIDVCDSLARKNQQRSKQHRSNDVDV